VDDVFIKIKFVKTDDNLSYSFTKNVSGETYEKFAQKFISTKEYWKEYWDPDKSGKGVGDTLAGSHFMSHGGVMSLNFIGDYG
jgi:hypothetical protein